MSTGGNVPTQGTTSAALTDAVKAELNKPSRGPRGQLGKGTPGSRVRARWVRFNAQAGAPKHMLSLKEFVRRAVSGPHTGPGWPAKPEWLEALQADIGAWLTSKGAGTPEQRKERAKRRKERKSDNYAAKLARKSKGKQKKKEQPADTSRR